MGKIRNCVCVLAMVGSQSLMAGPEQKVWDTFRAAIRRQLTSNTYSKEMPSSFSAIWNNGRKKVGITTFDDQGFSMKVEMNFQDYDPAVTTYWRAFEISGRPNYPIASDQLKFLYGFSKYMRSELFKSEKKRELSKVSDPGSFWRDHMRDQGVWCKNDVDDFLQADQRIFGIDGAHMDSLVRLNNQYTQDYFLNILKRPVPDVYHEFGYKPPVQ